MEAKNKRDFTDEELMYGIPWIPEPITDSVEPSPEEKEQIRALFLFVLSKIEELNEKTHQ